MSDRLTINDTCQCGAELALTDPAGAYLLPSGEKDEYGRKFCIERVYSEWLEAHKPCREEKP